MLGCSPEVSCQVLLDFLLGRGASFAAEESVHGHDKAGGAEATLAAMRVGKTLLHWVQAVSTVSNPCMRTRSQMLASCQFIDRMLSLKGFVSW